MDGQNISLDSPEAQRVVEPLALARALRAQRLGLYSILACRSSSLKTLRGTRKRPRTPFLAAPRASETELRRLVARPFPTRYRARRGE